MTVVNCLNCLGSARSIPLNDWVLTILRLLQRKKLYVTLVHIAGVGNIVADDPLGNKPLSAAWSLDADSFRWLCESEFVPEVDLFAMREIQRLPSFVALIPDPLASEVHAFSGDQTRWSSLSLFPPTSQILRVLPLLRTFRGRAILVTPDWPNQAWYPSLLRESSGPHLFQRVGNSFIWASSKVLSPLAYWIF